MSWFCDVFVCLHEIIAGDSGESLFIVLFVLFVVIIVVVVVVVDDFSIGVLLFVCVNV